MIIDQDALLRAIPKLAAKRIVIVGDVLLDEYLTGQASRLSREAPIPVLEFLSRHTIPGGAANPAMNIVALGSQATQVGLIGDDAIGRELVDALRAANVDTSGLVKDPARATTQKTRIVSQGSLRFPQQLARLDRIDRTPPPPTIEEALILQVNISAPVADAVLVSDYRNDLLSPALVQAVLDVTREKGNLSIVDSQGNLDKYRGYDVIRANDRDTAAYLNRPLTTEADFGTATAELLDRLDTHGIVIGRGAQGVSLRGRRTPYTHFPATNPTEVFDVTGAGDTSVALLALGLVARLSLAEAAYLSNVAAGLVVQKLGNATVSPSELTTTLNT